MDDFIHRNEYIIWNTTNPNTNSYFVEFGDTRLGANATSGVKYAKGLITKDEATRFII